MHHLASRRPGRALFTDTARLLRNCGMRRRQRSRNACRRSNIEAKRRAIASLHATSKHAFHATKRFRWKRDSVCGIAAGEWRELSPRSRCTASVARYRVRHSPWNGCRRYGPLPRSEVRTSSFPFLLDSGNILVDATDNAELKATAFRLSRIEVKKAKPSMVNLSRRRTIIGRVCFFAHIAARARSGERTAASKLCCGC